MNAQVLSANSKELSLSIKETDVGVLYIIQHELLKDSDTDFAGVIVKHPLTNECWMRVSSKSSPLKQVKKAAGQAIQLADEFKQLFNDTIKEN